MKHKKSLSRTIMVNMMLLGIVLVISLSIVIGILYKRSVVKEAHETVAGFCTAASDYIDGDSIKTYAQTLKPDDYYRQIEKYLSVLQDNTNVTFYYVYIPKENDVVIIWDTDENDAASDGTVLGQHQAYPDGGKEYCDAIFCKDPSMQSFITEDDTYGAIATASYPIFDKAGEPVALVGVDVALPGVREIFYKFVLTASLTVIIVILLSMIVYYFLVKKRILTPIRKLDDAAKHMVDHLDGDSDTALDIHADNELGELADSFSHMGNEVKDYINRLSVARAEKEKSDAELNVATQIQADMLPSIFPAFPEMKQFDLFASMHPAKEVGGDFYDFYMIGEDHLCLVIADVSGKGVPAALFMVIAKTLIKNKASQGGSPSETLEYVNNQLCDNNKADMFVTVWLGILELSTGIMTASNGGHEFPVVYHKSSDNFELLKDKHCFVLGALENTKYTEYTFRLDAGDRLFIYTDGVPEAINSDNVQYGTDRMLHELNDHKALNAEEILPYMLDSIKHFAGSAPQFDDITMLSITFLGNKRTDEPVNPSHIMTVAANNNNVQAVTDFVNDYLNEINCCTKSINQIDVALEELFSNVANYAYVPGTGVCTIEISKKDDRAVITLTDSGKAYDPTALPNPDTTLSAEERPIGGLGIFIVRKTMDDFYYKRIEDRNITTFEKKLN